MYVYFINYTYSNIYIIYDKNLTSNQTVKIRRQIEGYIEGELIDNYIDDYSSNEYNNITGICYSINIKGKYFVDITLNKKITDIVKNLYMNKVPIKYKKVSKALKECNFDKDVEINFEHVAYIDDEDGKDELNKIKKKLVKQYKVYDKENGLNQKPFNI